MRTIAFLSAAFVALAHACVCGAQDPDQSDFETWSDIRTVYNFTEAFAYDGDQGFRGVLSSEDWSLVYVRPSVRYKLKSYFALRGGVALVYLFHDVDAAELRFWEGVQLFWPTLNALRFDQYVRFEQRFLSIRQSDSEFAHRFRYRIRAQTFPQPVLKIPTPSTAMLAYEVFVYLDDPVWSSQLRKDRFYAGVGNRVSARWTVRLQYIYQRAEWNGEGGFATADHILRFRLIYVIH